MVQKFCYMRACPNRDGKVGPKQHFRIPTEMDVVTAEAWEQFINTGNRYDTFRCGSRTGVRLCADHFEPGVIGKKRLLKNAVPTIYPKYNVETAFKLNLIPKKEDSIYLTYLNNFDLSPAEYAEHCKTLSEELLIPLESEEEVDVDFDFKQHLVDPETGNIYEEMEMPMLGDLKQFAPQATSSFGQDPIGNQPLDTEPVVEVMETQDAGLSHSDARSSEIETEPEMGRMDQSETVSEDLSESESESDNSVLSIKDENTDPCQTPRAGQKRKLSQTPGTKAKRRAYVNDLSIGAFGSPRSVKKNLDLVQRKFNSMQSRLKVVQQKLRRALKKIKSLDGLLSYLKQEGHIDHETSRIIESAFPEENAAAQLFKRLIGKKTRGYSAELKKFALTLHFHSPAAYDFVREQFALCLPHPRTIRKLYATVDGKPGFTEEARTAIKAKVKEFEDDYAKNKNPYKKELVLALMCDEMMIRRKMEWVGGQCVGRVDCGKELLSLGDDSPLAGDAWVFMVVSVNDGWKLPVGYFLIDSLNGVQRANIMKECLIFLNSTGATVASVTFDGNQANITSVECLGACMNPSKPKWQPWFPHPCPERAPQKVYVILDPAHMLKLWRNNFGREKLQMLDINKRLIKFAYLEKLHDLQSTEGLLLGNRVRRRHIYFGREVMKVRLAAQLLSRSAADALLYLEQDLKRPDFQGCAGTTDFIRIADEIFDILNSRNCSATEKQKQPLSNYNINYVKSVFEKADKYIRGLEVKYTDTKGCRQQCKILYSYWKTGFLGFLGGLEVAISLHRDYVQGKKILKFIPMYKFSQDHLENFFSAIRGRGGWNPNPTATRFMSAYKKLLVNTALKSKRDGANCWPLELISILNVSTTARKKSSTISDNVNDSEEAEAANESDIDDMILAGWDYEKPLQELILLSPIVTDVVEYIAGYVGMGVVEQGNCPGCASALIGQESTSLLLKRKNRGGLFIPSTDLVRVCRLTERSVRQRAQEKCLLTMAVKRHALYVKRELDSDIFAGVADHDVEHRNDLINSVIKKYLVLRICHDIKKLDEKIEPVRVRAQYNKMILFQRQ